MTNDPMIAATAAAYALDVTKPPKEGTPEFAAWSDAFSSDGCAVTVEPVPMANCVPENRKFNEILEIIRTVSEKMKKEHARL